MVWEVFPDWWYIVHIRSWLDLASDGYVQFGLLLVVVNRYIQWLWIYRIVIGHMVDVANSLSVNQILDSRCMNRIFSMIPDT